MFFLHVLVKNKSKKKSKYKNEKLETFLFVVSSSMFDEQRFIPQEILMYVLNIFTIDHYNQQESIFYNDSLLCVHVLLYNWLQIQLSLKQI